MALPRYKGGANINTKIGPIGAISTTTRRLNQTTQMLDAATSQDLLNIGKTTEDIFAPMAAEEMANKGLEEAWKWNPTRDENGIVEQPKRAPSYTYFGNAHNRAVEKRYALNLGMDLDRKFSELRQNNSAAYREEPRLFEEHAQEIMKTVLENADPAIASKVYPTVLNTLTSNSKAVMQESVAYVKKQTDIAENLGSEKWAETLRGAQVANLFNASPNEGIFSFSTEGSILVNEKEIEAHKRTTIPFLMQEFPGRFKTSDVAEAFLMKQYKEIGTKAIRERYMRMGNMDEQKIFANNLEKGLPESWSPEIVNIVNAMDFTAEEITTIGKKLTKHHGMENERKQTILKKATEKSEIMSLMQDSPLLGELVGAVYSVGQNAIESGHQRDRDAPTLIEELAKQLNTKTSFEISNLLARLKSGKEAEINDIVAGHELENVTYLIKNLFNSVTGMDKSAYLQIEERTDIPRKEKIKLLKSFYNTLKPKAKEQKAKLEVNRIQSYIKNNDFVSPEKQQEIASILKRPVSFVRKLELITASSKGLFIENTENTRLLIRELNSVRGELRELGFGIDPNTINNIMDNTPPKDLTKALKDLQKEYETRVKTAETTALALMDYKAGNVKAIQENPKLHDAVFNELLKAEMPTSGIPYELTNLDKGRVMFNMMARTKRLPSQVTNRFAALANNPLDTDENQSVFLQQLELFGQTKERPGGYTALKKAVGSDDFALLSATNAKVKYKLGTMALTSDSMMALQAETIAEFNRIRENWNKGWKEIAKQNHFSQHFVDENKLIETAEKTASAVIEESAEKLTEKSISSQFDLEAMDIVEARVGSPEYEYDLDLFSKPAFRQEVQNRYNSLIPIDVPPDEDYQRNLLKTVMQNVLSEGNWGFSVLESGKANTAAFKHSPIEALYANQEGTSGYLIRAASNHFVKQMDTIFSLEIPPGPHGEYMRTVQRNLLAVADVGKPLQWGEHFRLVKRPGADGMYDLMLINQVTRGGLSAPVVLGLEPFNALEARNKENQFLNLSGAEQIRIKQEEQQTYAADVIKAKERREALERKHGPVLLSR